MKWFKHDCNALKDEKIQSLMNKHGQLAYVMYFGILELCGEKIDKNLNPRIEIDWTYAEALMHSKRKAMRKVLVSFAEASLLLTEANDKLMICSVPNLLKRLDNYTKDLVVATKKLPSKDQEPEVRSKNQNLNPGLKDEKDGFLNEKEKTIVLKDIAKSYNVSETSQSAKFRLDEIVKEIANVKDVKNALALARHKALKQK